MAQNSVPEEDLELLHPTHFECRGSLVCTTTSKMYFLHTAEMKPNLKTMNNEPFTPFSKHEQSRCPRASTSERWTAASQGPDSKAP